MQSSEMASYRVGSLAGLAAPWARAGHIRMSTRSLVSPAFHCEAAWASRLDTGEARVIFSRIHPMAELFVELDRKFTNQMGVADLDIDIFANAAESESELEQLEELLFKLRRTPHTVHTGPSTCHAAVRAMVGKGAGQEQLGHLIRMLEDRTNYGLFLDSYTAVLLLDKLLEEGRLAMGARVASQLMLQEDQDLPANTLGNLASWRYFLQRETVPWFGEDEKEQEEVDDPEDVIRIRVKEGPPHFGMVPNNHHDDHFDIREPVNILGKTLWYLNKSGDDPVSRSLTLLGLVLWGREEEALQLPCDHLVEEVREQILVVSDTDSMVAKLNAADTVSVDVDEELLKRCKEVLVEQEAAMVVRQEVLYKEWNQTRDDRLTAHVDKQRRQGKMEGIVQKKEELSREEQKLFFFDNKFQLDQEKEEKVLAWKRSFPKRSWGSHPNYFAHPKWQQKVAGREAKTPRWEKTEAKKGPPK